MNKYDWLILREVSILFFCKWPLPWFSAVALIYYITFPHYCFGTPVQVSKEQKRQVTPGCYYENSFDHQDPQTRCREKHFTVQPEIKQEIVLYEKLLISLPVYFNLGNITCLLVFIPLILCRWKEDGI